MARTGRGRKQQWGRNTIVVQPPDKGRISWHYDDDRGHSYVSVSSDDTWAYVSTDDYEGTAMFPLVLVKDVIRELRKIVKEKEQRP